jgi:hypothetical protein
MSLFKIRDSQTGEWISIPSIVGPRGERGSQGIQGI